ncbi:zf-HC2 domain-containing protein [Paenibacillus glycanilyticus]|uniref:zf-HC2 domain-containing protein n=1 Tax=Paenibacillus glycanilyticus TaxID=126569 RepID=UPI00203B0BCB|nr:zf-HC2 domain-containing protein [Paenibacillus glycanilyticus]MCM3626684.1 zf-HC2 domain-containing protein [Paenibacillus glycanilyticus]
MIKCHIVQDLLPSYIDGLLSAETEHDLQQHLQECEACRELLAKLSTSIDNANLHVNKKEIDFLKKVRKKATKKVVTGLTVLLLVFALFTYLMAIGSPISKKDLIYNTSVEGDLWQINMELTNGKALLVKTEPIYGKKDRNGIKPIVGVLVKPRELLPSPILESDNTSFMFGSTIESFNKGDYKVILRLGDGDIVFTSDNYDR